MAEPKAPVIRAEEVVDGVPVNCASCAQELHVAAVPDHPVLCASCYEFRIELAAAQARGFRFGV